MKEQFFFLGLNSRPQYGHPWHWQVLVYTPGWGAHQEELLSPAILGLGVNPFPSKFINRRPPSVRRANPQNASLSTLFAEHTRELITIKHYTKPLIWVCLSPKRLRELARMHSTTSYSVWLFINFQFIHGFPVPYGYKIGKMMHGKRENSQWTGSWGPFLEAPGNYRAR